MSNFENACLKACEDWVNKIDLNIEPEYSKEHIKRIKDISKGKGNTRFGSKKLCILLVAAIVLLLSVTAFATVKSKQFNLDVLSPNTYNFMIDNAGQKSVDDIEYGYIPEGFKEVDREFRFKDIMVGIQYPECEVKFSNGEQYFLLVKFIEDLQFSVDKRRENFMRIEDSGINYVFIEEKATENITSVFWDNNGYAYMILVSNSSLSQEELLKIARDVK